MCTYAPKSTSSMYSIICPLSLLLTEMARQVPSGLRTAQELTPCLLMLPGDSLYEVNRICN